MSTNEADQKLKIKELEEKLEEKEGQLAGMQHRVKNNFHFIISLLQIQALSTESPQVKGNLESAMGRIHVVAEIYTQIYETENNQVLSIKELLNRLIHYFERKWRKNIDIKLVADNFSLNVSQAISFGLLIRELVTNAFAHAFPAGEAGTIQVALNTQENAQAQLSISDNGIGLPPHINVRAPITVGLKLVSILSKQLRGKYEISRDEGTHFSLTFPLDHKNTGGEKRD